MRPGEFFEAMDAYRKDRDADRRHQGELARGMTLRIFNILVGKQYRISNPAELWRMPWDEEDAEEIELKRLRSLTDEERAEEAKKAAERLKL